MRIIFMGTPDFAAGALQSLIDAGHEIALVVTKPDKPVGRGGRVAFSAVKELALARELEIYQPVRIRDAEAVERLRAAQADIGVVAAFGQILSAEALAAPRLGCVNIHASLLPRYRGSSPIQQALLDGAERTGVTIMQMDEGCDTGDILLQEECPIAADETAGSLFDRLEAIGASLIVRALAALDAGELRPVKQDEALATSTHRIGKEEGEIRWHHGAAAIERQIRAMSPWPSAYTRLPDGRVLKLWKAAVADPAEADGGASFGDRRGGGEPETAGTVRRVTKDALYISCGEDTCLRVTELQLEGKKRMSVHDFLLGAAIAEGTVL